MCDLSGGQKRRLQLMLILLDKPNVLILDEPDNDLDIDMLAVVESLLDTWPGTLLLITHDRYLMERVTDDQFAIVDGKIRHVPGGVDEYLRLVDERARGEPAGRRRRSPTKPTSGQTADSAGAVESRGVPLKKELASTERKLDTLVQEGRRDPRRDEGRRILRTTWPCSTTRRGSRTSEQQIAELEDKWMELSDRLAE